LLEDEADAESLVDDADDVLPVPEVDPDALPVAVADEALSVDELPLSVDDDDPASEADEEPPVADAVSEDAAEVVLPELELLALLPLLAPALLPPFSDTLQTRSSRTRSSPLGPFSGVRVISQFSVTGPSFVFVVFVVCTVFGPVNAPPPPARRVRDDLRMVRTGAPLTCPTKARKKKARKKRRVSVREGLSIVNVRGSGGQLLDVK